MINTLFLVLAISCGTERWDIKTTADKAFKSSFNREYSSISELIKKDPPIYIIEGQRYLPVEGTIYTIKGFVNSYKHEPDGDIHVIIFDLSKNTMIIELPSLDCIRGARLKKSITKARKDFEAVFPKYGSVSKFKQVEGIVHITVSGVGFFDRIHGQRGVAKNGIELHPVTKIVFEITPK